MDEEFSFSMIQKVLEKGSYFHIKGSAQLNKCIDHIIELIEESYLLYTNGHYAGSSFIAIAVIEEVGKVHLGIFTNPEMKETKKDLLRDHKTKDIIGAPYTIYLGKRLHDAITEAELTEIFQMAYDGRLKEMREKAIYCDSQDGVLTTPDDVFSPRFAKNLLLFCIESFDDALVGYTSHSIEVSTKTDVIFDELCH